MINNMKILFPGDFKIYCAFSSKIWNKKGTGQICNDKNYIKKSPAN